MAAGTGEIYAKLLEKPSLGVLVRLPNLMQYYGREEPASQNGPASLDPARFHLFGKKDSKKKYHAMALAAHGIYGPLAEFFGYTKQLAGDLDLMSYSYLNRKLYDKVMWSIRDIHNKVKATNRIMDVVVAQLRSMLSISGYDCDINVRGHKHEGRVMDKIERKLKEEGGSIPRHVAALKDLAAFTVVLHSYKDREIQQTDTARFTHVTDIIRGLVSGLESFDFTFTDHISKPKDNGYQSLHLDMVFHNPALVGMEALVRNTHMDWIARDGGAAHYLYTGGGAEIESIRRAYHNVREGILRGLGNGLH